MLDGLISSSHSVILYRALVMTFSINIIRIVLQKLYFEFSVFSSRTLKSHLMVYCSLCKVILTFRRTWVS
jgi:hypothetical protein